MAILMNVEARVVSKRTKQPLEEYQKSDSTVGANESFVEKYIEAKTGEDFQVEVFLKDNFICWGGWGIRFNIKIDGGVVHYGKTYSKAEVSLKEPIVFDSVRFFEGPAFSRIGFRFGSLRMNEDIELSREDLETHAATLGLIEVSVYRVSRKLKAHPEPKGAFYRPLATVDVAKDLLKQKHVDSVMQPGKKSAEEDPGLSYYDFPAYTKYKSCRMTFKFRYRSEMNLRLLGLIDRDPTPTHIDNTEREQAAVLNTGDAVEGRNVTPLIVPKVESQATMDTQTDTVPDTRGLATRDYYSIVEEVQSLKRQLLELQDGH